MGASCVMLLVLNGAISALFHSRTKRAIAATLGECAGCCASHCPGGGMSFGCLPCCAERKEGGGGDAPKRAPCCDPGSTWGLACCGSRKWVGIKIGSRQDVWRWMPAATLYAGTTLFLVLATRGARHWQGSLPRWLRPMQQQLEEKFRFVLADPADAHDFLGAFGLTTKDAPTMVARLLRHMYGTRMAADGWHEEYPSSP